MVYFLGSLSGLYKLISHNLANLRGQVDRQAANLAGQPDRQTNTLLDIDVIISQAASKAGQVRLTAQVADWRKLTAQV